ncbi:beta-lactamase family protein [Micromonospora sp. R77]|uniref:serine hydrolase domain-containing protein n=1 Tax=Micromonospora sp. R77 TaxID=2925836 RepID=UPI001F5FFFDA|nr:serine hydrolase domain-containing protein [Micromonospora sp. R77]MCI4061556.1 beta-lactamase family protein [Micromonospora sp. R77]
MDGTTVDRRTFGKLVGAAGVGTLGAGALGAAPAGAALPIWTTSGTAVSSLSAFDDTMKSFMLDRQISAGQLAVTYQGRLVLARGYGNNSPQNIRPTTLFRVASLSKSLTAAALVRLAQDGKLSLGDPVTKFLDFIPPAGQTVDPRLSQVTLWRLLQHTGGWDKDLTNFDPVFRDKVIADALGVPMELTHADVIRFMSGQPLMHDPGSTVSYSNYGYLLAGRIIEKVSGLPYETYVQQALLAPRGITRMASGWTIGRRSGEVGGYGSQYTGPTVLDNSGTIVNAPYGTFSMRIHDANGGWLASAVDLVRWAATFDSGNTVLNSTSLSRVFAVPNPTGVNADGWYYGLGWQVRPVTGGTGRNTWHTGSFAGTYSIMVRTYQGMSWAAVLNRRDDESGLSYSTIDSALWAASRAVTSWPTHNLWSTYFG